jgi:hypothetical protein
MNRVREKAPLTLLFQSFRGNRVREKAPLTLLFQSFRGNPLLLLVATLGLLTGCLPTSTHPLGSLESATPEERLSGVWYGKSGDDEIFLHFVQGKGAELQVVEVDHEAKGEAHTTLYRAFPSAVEGNHYLNVRADKQEDYYFVRYQISPSGVLSLSLMTDAAAAKAINHGKLKGKISGSDNNKDIKFTDSSEHLAAFLAKADPDLLFSQKFGTFKRVTLPALTTPEVKKPSVKKSAPTQSKHSAHPKKKKVADDN